MRVTESRNKAGTYEISPNSHSFLCLAATTSGFFLWLDSRLLDSVQRLNTHNTPGEKRHTEHTAPFAGFEFSSW